MLQSRRRPNPFRRDDSHRQAGSSLLCQTLAPIPPASYVTTYSGEIMQVPPWVSLTVAVIALIGVLATALVTYINASRARVAEEARRLASEKHTLELQSALL